MARHHNIDCLVDTDPMARKMNDVKHGVEGTTVAVVAMKAAVVAADEKASKMVCRNVNRGFFTLMHSQMSQKIAAKKSRTEALLMELFQQKKRLLEIKSTMQRDYQRIAARYNRIITGINKALKQRIVDLDRPVFDFCEKDVAITNNRISLLSGTVPVGQEENITLSQQILASNLKARSLTAINTTKMFLKQMNEQKILTNKIVLSSVEAKNSECYIPVIITSAVIDRVGNETLSCSVPDATSPIEAQNITNEMRERSDKLPWKTGKDDPNVYQEFLNRVQSAPVSSRVKDMMTKLYGKANTQNL